MWTLIVVLLAGSVIIEPVPAEAQVPAPSVTATIVNVVDLSLIDPSIPDPTGVVYDSATGRLLVSDSEVEETGLFAGINVFDVSTGGALNGGGSTLSFSFEPVGLGMNPANRHLFIGDDVQKKVFEVAPGADGKHLTSDDTVTSFDTAGFGSSDPEGVEYDPVTGYVYVLDGAARKLFRVDPGPNGLFDGVTSDDVITSIDVGAMGAQDPEGLAVDVSRRVLLVSDHISGTIYEVTRSGALFRTVDISNGEGHRVAGLTVAPGTVTPGVDSVFLVYRGVDNDTNPDENDGVLAEIFIPPPPAPPGGTFIDDDGNSQEGNIEAIAALEITKGCNPPFNDRFCPTDNVTRAEMAVFLVRGMGAAGSLPPYQGYFSDVAQGMWFTPWVERLFELGVTIGYQDGTYRPDKLVSRGEMAVFLIVAFNHTSQLTDPLGIFDDVEPGAFYADDAELLRLLGITAGCFTSPLRYCPNDPVRRDHMATFLARSMNLPPIVAPPA